MKKVIENQLRFFLFRARDRLLAHFGPFLVILTNPSYMPFPENLAAIRSQRNGSLQKRILELDSTHSIFDFVAIPIPSSVETLQRPYPHVTLIVFLQEDPPE